MSALLKLCRNPLTFRDLSLGASQKLTVRNATVSNASRISLARITRTVHDKLYPAQNEEDIGAAVPVFNLGWSALHLGPLPPGKRSGAP